MRKLAFWLLVVGLCLTATVAYASGATSIFGTSAGEKISGTDEPDVIYGLGGDDRIWGLEDADTVYGGAGDDRLHARTNDDVDRGLVDTVNGGRGFDRCEGNSSVVFVSCEKVRIDA